MKQLNPELWEQIPKTSRMLLLNNVYCRQCCKASSISNATIERSNNDFLIKGNCVNCHGKVARLVGGEVRNKHNVKSKVPDSQQLIKLAKFSKNKPFQKTLDDCKPLQLTKTGIWDPHEYKESIDPSIYQTILTLGCRAMWEMEQVLPEEIPSSIELMEDCPILQGIALQDKGNKVAIQYFQELLVLEPRCIDAYVHLGNVYFNMGAITKAKTMQTT